MNLINAIWEEIIAALVVAVLAYVFGRLSSISQKTRKYIIFVIFVLILIASGFLFFYPEASTLKVATLGLAIFALTNWYYYDITTQQKVGELQKKVNDQEKIFNERQQIIVELEKKLKEQPKITAQQIGRSYTVGTRGQNHIDVRILNRKGLAPGKELDLTWETIFDGVEALAKQISRYKGGCRPDFILGVNELGTILASYLNSRLWQGEKEIGVIRSGVPDEETKKRRMVYSIPETLLNDKSNGLRILLVDSEIKSGRSAKQIIDSLSEKFTVRQIYLAVLTACRVNCPVEDMAHLMYKKDNKAQEQPIPVPIDFLAFFTTGDVEPPGALR